MRNFFIQSLVVSVLTTQFITVLSLAVAEKESPAAIVGNSNMLRSLYPRSVDLKQAPLPEKDGAVENAAGSPRGQRCVKCGGGYGNGYGGAMGGGYGNYGNYYGNYADRYYDDYYYYNRDRGAYYGREDPYAVNNRDPYYNANTQRDRNWYYQPDRYGSGTGQYDRNPYDRYNYYNRYDDRYSGRTNPYESPDPYNQNTNYNSYRGNGYDNLNPQYYEAMREQFNQRGRGYNDYDRNYDRPAYRGYYDNRNFRPYDETYRGTAGFDLSGRGYYFANQQPLPHYPYQPPPYESYPNFVDNNNLPPPHQQYSPHSTPVIQPEFYNGKPAQAPSSSSSSSNSQNTQTVSSNTIGVDTGGATNNNKNNNKESLDNKDKVSTAYGGRPQSLGSSYLFERTDDANVGSGMNPPVSGAIEKKQESANLEMKSEA